LSIFALQIGLNMLSSGSGLRQAFIEYFPENNVPELIGFVLAGAIAAAAVDWSNRKRNGRPDRTDAGEETA
jgi:hypothetical protein